MLSNLKHTNSGGRFMAGFNKVVTSYEDAMAGLGDNMTVIAGGFGLCGIPENLIAQIKTWAPRV